MKLVTLLSAGALAAGTLVAGAAPAEAQRWGYGQHRGWHGGYRHYRPYRRGPAYGYGYRPYRGYARSRVVCRVHRGYYGPVRRCFRAYR